LFDKDFAIKQKEIRSTNYGDTMKKIVLFIVIVFLVNTLLGREYRPGDHELCLMPTAYTMPVGDRYFTDYELAILNFTFAPSEGTHLGIFSLFPVTKQFVDTFSFGIKQNYMRIKYIESAVWLAFVPKIKAVNIGNVISVSNENSSVHIGISALSGSFTKKTEYVFMIGSKFKLSERTSLIAEYGNLQSWITEEPDGIALFGIRFQGKRVAWDIAGIRPLFDVGNDLLIIPLVKATVYFSK